MIQMNEAVVSGLKPKVERKQASDDERRAFNLMYKNLEIDKTEIKNIEKEKDDYLLLSLS